MMTSDIRTGVRLGSLVAFAALLLACGGKVVFVAEGEGGAGGTGSSNVAQNGASTADSAQSSTSGGSVICSDEEETCSGIGTDVCKCTRKCGFAELRANCSPDEKGVVVCICSYDDVFSGTCFEKTDAYCDIDVGCCAKYFQGI